MSIPTAQAVAAALPPTSSARHRVIELFAGVGGFHHGLSQANQHCASMGLPPAYEVVWSNQWEPGCRHQHAARVYEARWGLAPVNRDLFAVLDDEDEMARLDALRPTMLVGGFPCQDYSVAKPASRSEGLNGKKGVLWWGIHRLLQRRVDAGQPVEVLMLENVDRLLSSPGPCKGRDFAIILSSLQALGYSVAWQVVNAADYGFPQKRKRVFLVGLHESSPRHAEWRTVGDGSEVGLALVSPIALGLPVELTGPVSQLDIGSDVFETQASFQPGKGGRSPFQSVGMCVAGRVWTAPARAAAIGDFTPYVGQTRRVTLGDVVRRTAVPASSYFLAPDSLPRWQYLKGAKRIERVTASGHAYAFSEGAVAFPDPLDRPSRTIITSEGGAAASRTKHAVLDPSGRLRRLTPEELEELNGFPRGFTALPGVPDTKRAFLMGNALVTGVVARIALGLLAA